MNQQLILDISPTPAQTLENFVVGANQEVLNALEACAPGRAIYLYGPPGAGRTHLLKAMALQWKAPFFDATSRPLEIKRLAETEHINTLLVAIDDVDKFSTTAQAAVFALYNRWREVAATGRAFALLLSGREPPIGVKVREDLRTRLGWDLVFRLSLLSDEQRAEVMERRADQRNLHLTPEVMNWVLNHYERDMSRVIALIDALDHYSLTRKRHITLPLLRDLLAEGKLPT